MNEIGTAEGTYLGQISQARSEGNAVDATFRFQHGPREVNETYDSLHEDILANETETVCGDCGDYAGVK